MGNLELCVNYAKKRSRELRREFLALGYRESREELIGGLSEDERTEFEERAAILEYDGGLPKEEAERLALKEILINPNGARE